MKDTKFRDDIRPALRHNNVAKIMKKDPNKTYCLVRFDEDYDPNATNIELYESKGWSIESDTTEIKDERSNAPGSKKEDSLRKHPITKQGRGKAQFVLMSIDKETLLKSEEAKVQRNKDRYIASSTGRKAVKKGGTMTITDSEVNESNMNSASDI